MGKPRNPITGSDFAGIVESVGNEVSQFKPGDRVMGLNTDQLSSHCEYIVIGEDEAVVKIPDELSFSVAAASLEGAHYAYNFIKRIPDLPGKKVLVNGATGAIGSAGLQFLKYHGALVTAVCRAEHEDIVRDMGVDAVIAYDRVDFTQTDSKFDVVFDAVGKSTFGKCRRVLTQQGLYISSELGPKVQNPLLALITPLGKGQQVKFPVPTDTKRSLNYIMDRLKDGSFKPLIDREYAFDDIREAYRYVLQGEKVGNVILNFQA
ncbi:NAD(P)-dependent alcohol dehydrogenase [Gracilimonas mengyeensis]|uniref:NADPH:quinone reductase n=1 Tax=Gracilimonas mengyeensis TaxID=1302730 RepID=A0A521DWJ2_9BACT|nr:NAD(P)-dependent alcohol dehydrogenase [Gracilimonas mengyeensis]SMO76109.1 NADPH:quinone reductase [Gracilimonas mengyeensis]